jgi:DNA-binding response OmpR family regulator
METKKHILIVDDNDVNAGIFEEYLVDKGFDVATAGTAAAGFQKIAERKPDLILLDVYLPDKMGYDVCTELRDSAATRNIPIILCTAKDLRSDEKIKGFHHGADDYLVKPFELAELLVRIQAILRRTNVQPRPELLAGIEALIGQKSSVKKPAVEPPPPPISRPISPAPVEPKLRPKHETLHVEFFQRLWQILNEPAEVTRKLRPQQDFLMALILVLITPTIASLAKLSEKTGSFDAWIGHLSLGLVTNLLMWFGIAGALTLLVPFYGHHFTMKRALTLAGMGWAPRFLGAALSALYASSGLAGFVLDRKDFSAGIDLIPGLPSSDWLSFLGHIGLFDFWCTAITLIGLWTICDVKEKRWNTVTIVVGFLCLAFGALTSY